MSVCDPLPPRFAYVSRRLTKEIRDHEVARNGNFTVTEKTTGGEAGIPEFGKVSFGATHERGEDTPDSLAFDATAALKRQQRIREVKDVDANGYFRLTCDLYVGLFNQANIWDNGKVGSSQDVAVLYGQPFVAGVGRVFICLFGSAQNLIPAITKARLSMPTPSDADGLYLILESAREQAESAVEPDKLNSRRQLEMTDEYRVSSAATTVRMIRRPLPARRWDVLGKAFIIARDQRIDVQPNASSASAPRYGAQHSDLFDLAIVGTAIWAGFPEQLVDPLMTGDFERAKVDAWELLEEEVFQAAFFRNYDEIPALVTSTDPNEQEWFASWFFDNAERAGAPISRLFKQRKRGWINPKRYTDAVELPAQLTSTEGVVISYDDREYALISTTGDIFLVELLYGTEAEAMGENDWAWDEETELTDDLAEHIKEHLWQFALEIRQTPVKSQALCSLPLHRRETPQAESEG